MLAGRFTLNAVCSWYSERDCYRTAFGVNNNNKLTRFQRKGLKLIFLLSFIVRADRVMDGIVEHVYAEPSIPPVIGECYTPKSESTDFHVVQQFFYTIMILILYNVLLYTHEHVGPNRCKIIPHRNSETHLWYNAIILVRGFFHTGFGQINFQIVWYYSSG